ncbi:MAG: hypothetical protein CMO80_11135 [Verrucomicrobiales bacterium]|nr:hypothetical protein [Verrucomicrobiales bacterium]|tara:strand:- start:24 stop:614 length:591 start_codon:yes stop_codon:yes gene_type:complete
MTRQAIGCVLALMIVLPGTSFSGEKAAIKIADLDGRKLKPLNPAEKGSILFFVTHDCPVSNAYSPEIRRIHREFAKQGFSCAIAYVDPDAKTDALKKHRQEFGLSEVTAFHDRRHQLVKATGATVTPEAVLIDTEGRTAYRGRIDNLYADFGKRRRKATVTDLRDALHNLIAGKPISNARTEAIGCYIPKPRKNPD